MKTPEERAAEWINGMAGFSRFDPLDVPAVEDLVAGAIREAVDEALAAAAPRWISVAERLPERELDPVLVWIDGGDMDVCYLEGGRWTTGDGRRYQHGAVTHWMPYLPGPR